MQFRDFVAARWPTPEDALVDFFHDAQATALDAGARLEEIPVLDGRRQYLPSPNGRRDKRQFLKASVVVDPDGTAWPTITFKSFRHGGATTWWKPRDLAWSMYQRHGRGDSTLDAEAAQRYAARLAIVAEEARTSAAERERADAAGQDAAAMAASTAWESASGDCGGHQYLTEKHVLPFGLRVATTTTRAALWDSERQRWVPDAIVARAGDLLVPVRTNDGQLVNLQRIDASGRKLFVRGARKRGCFHLIPGKGDPWGAEGYSTAASVHQASGRPVVVAFDAGNLAAVSTHITAVAADNDESGTGQRAAEATGLPWAMPPQMGEDFNDLHAREGLAAVRAALEHMRQPAPPEASVFDTAFDLPPVPELPTKRDELISALHKTTAPTVESAAIAWAVAKRLSVGVPVRESVESISAVIRDAMPRHTLADGTLHALEGGIRWIVGKRRRNAVAAVSPSPQVLAPHLVERTNALPSLSARDYRGVIVLRAPMGSSKTQRIGVPFARWASRQDGRFIALAHRQSLIEELAARLGCDHYQRVSGDEAVHVNSLATCLPSIVKTEHAQIIRECRWLFVDEISQVIRSLAARVTVADRKTMADVLEALRNLVAGAECVIVADAGIDDRTIRFIESCRPGVRIRYLDAAVLEGTTRTAEFGYGPDALQHAYGDMLAELANGRRLWVACGEKSRAVECARLLESSGRRVLLLTSDNAGTREQAQFLAEPDRLSRLYDAVVASPVISSGVSIEHIGRPWFDRVFLIASGATITPADAMQQARRVRYVPALSVVVTPSNRQEIESADAILIGLEQASALEGAHIQASELDSLVAHIEAGDAQQRADFSAGLWWLLERAGYQVRQMAVADGTVTAEDLKMLRAEISQERRDAILAARDLSEFEARRLRNRPVISEDDSAALLRHRIVRDLGLVEPLADGDLDDWDEGRGPRAWDRWTAAFKRIAEDSDSREVADLHRRRFGRARVAAYAYLFDGFPVGPGFRVTGDVSAVLLGRMYQRRQLLAVLGIVPAKWAGDQFALPTGNAATRAMGDLFERMGLKLKRREGTATPKSVNTSLGSKATFGGGSDRNRWYEVMANSWSRAAALAERRNARRVLERVPVETEDYRYWLSLRRDILAKRMPLKDAAALILTTCEERGHATPTTFGERSAVFWIRHVYAPEWRQAVA
nr:plasmid replication protein, CyRepA1 family [Stenotrophomonas acidaminiphila]